MVWSNLKSGHDPQVVAHDAQIPVSVGEYPIPFENMRSDEGRFLLLRLYTSEANYR